MPPAASRRQTATATASVVVEQERRQAATGAELVAATGSVGGVDGVAEVAQPLDVAAHAAGRDAEPVGELGAAPDGSALEQVEQAQHAAVGPGLRRTSWTWRQHGTVCGQDLSYTAATVRDHDTRHRPPSTLDGRSSATRLDWHWTNQLRPRLDGLTDDEYLWEPTPGAWNVHPRGQGATEIQGGSGELTIDFAYPEPVLRP